MRSVLKCSSSASNPNEKNNKTWFQVVIILLVSLTTITTGQLLTWTSVAIPQMLSEDYELNLTFDDVSYLPIVSTITVLITSPLVIYLCGRFGRKPILLFANIPYLISWILIAFSKSLVLFYIALLIEGIGRTAVMIALPIYIGEIAEPKIRGTWSSSIVVNVSLGQFLMNVMGSFLDIKTSALISIIFPIVSLITIPFITESPYFLLMKERENEARDSLQRLRRTGDVDVELNDMKAAVERQISESVTMRDLFAVETNRRSLWIVNCLRFFQQFSGSSVFFAYTQYIFQLANGDLSKSTSAMIFTGLFVVTSLYSGYLLEKLGRKLALVISCTGSAIALTIESIYFYCTEYAQVDVSNFGWVPITGLLLYGVFFSIGLGTAPVLLMGELFSTGVKEKAVGITVIIAGVLGIISAVPFPALVGTYGLFAPLTIYTVCTYASIIFTVKYVPETKGQTLEEIQQNLQRTTKSLNKMSSRH